MAAVLPINKIIVTTYSEITADIVSMDLAEAERFTIYNDSGPRVEVIVDNTGVAVIDDTYDKRGVDVNSEQAIEFTFKSQTRYYARAKTGSTTLIKINKLGPMNVHDVDYHSVPFNELFHEHTGIATTLALPVAAGDTEINVVSTVGFNIGNDIQIENGVIETTFPTVNNIVGNVFTLDRPLDNDFAAGNIVEAVDYNMNVVGTLASPVSFKLVPDSDQQWHVMGFALTIVHASAGDDSRFGDILGGLLNGATLRAYNGLSDQYRTFTNWKDNADIALDTGGVTYSDKAGGGNFGTFSLGEIKIRSGAIPKLNGANGDFLEILIQDDLSTLIKFNIKAQGHIATL